MVARKKHVAVRLAPDVVARLDALIPRLSRRWRDATRSDVLRALVATGLDAVEADPSALDEPPA